MVHSIEIDSFLTYGDAMFCMFCGEQILYPESEPTPCSHVLFITNSEAGYDYQSDKIIDVLPDWDSDEPFIDNIESSEELPTGSFMITSSAPAPSGLTVCIGFAPYI